MIQRKLHAFVSRLRKIYTQLCKSKSFFIFHRTFNVVGFDFAQRLLQ